MDHDPKIFAPRLDRASDRLAERMAALRQGQRRQVAADEKRDDRHVHVGREKVQWHSDRMIDRIVLRHAHVVAGPNRGGANVRGQSCV
jgi:hypothetical protein